MGDQVVMSKANGYLAVAIPLFRQKNIGSYGTGYTICVLTEYDLPLAYLIDCGPHGRVVWSAKYVENSMTFLGDL